MLNFILLKGIKNRNKRLRVYKGITALYIVSTTLLIIADIISDIVYVIKIEFYNQGIQAAAIIFLILIPISVYTLALAWLMKLLEKAKKGELVTSTLSQETHLADPKYIKKCLLYWVFLGPAASVLYPISRKFYKFFDNAEVRLIMSLSSIQFLGESLPHLIIQAVNNTLMDSWTHFTRFSFVMSTVSLLQGCFVLSTLYYKFQYEKYLKDIENEELGKICESVGVSEGINEEDLTTFIKIKFYEKFDLGLVIFTENNLPLEKFDEKKHEQVEDELQKIYDKRFKFQYDHEHFKSHILSPLYILISLEVLLMFIIWLCNLLYLFIAKFETETVRYGYFFFLCLTYIIAISGRFKANNVVIFEKFMIFRLLSLSHFKEIVFLFYNKNIETEHDSAYEVILILFSWVPIISIQADNNHKIGRDSGIYSGVIVLNSLCLTLSAVRALYRLVTESLKKKPVIPNDQSLPEIVSPENPDSTTINADLTQTRKGTTKSP